MPNAIDRRNLLRRPALVCELLEDRNLLSNSPTGLLTPLGSERPFMDNEVVLRFQSQAPLEEVGSYLGQWLSQGINLANQNHVGGVSAFGLSNYEELLRTQEEGWNVSIVHAFLTPGSDLQLAIDAASSLSFVSWAQRNYIYGTDGDPRELIPNDPQYASQYHHPLMGNPTAWNTTQGQGVVIAVTDDGVSITHEDLQANVWINTDEIAANGIDDDNNGYIDDRNGWDFSSNDNNPNPVGSDTHGTHVSGIAAGRTGNGLGIAGTAGQATIMPVRFYGSGAWTSTVILNSYRYAVNNGAKIISTSYNIDSFVGDSVFLQAVNYVYDNGVLHFNSAGNNNQLNPARQSFDQMLFVSSTDSGDIKSSFSNYGFGIDVAAPGSSILATLAPNTYGTQSGTSMSTPNAAGVAALIWSAHPTWTRDQVAAQIVGTADNLDLLNPNYAGLLGSGRVNAATAVGGFSKAPRVDEVLGLATAGGKIESTPTSFSVQMQGVLDPTTANNAANWRLVGAGADGAFGTADDVNVAITKTTTYRIGTNRISFNINGTLTGGRYRFIASENLLDPHGQRLDGNGDLTPGGDFIHQFTFNPINKVMYGPGLGAYYAVATTYGFQNIATTGTSLIAGSVNDSSVQITAAQLNGFSFQYYGTTYSTLWVSSNGLITFGSANSTFLNTQFTTLTTQAAIAPFWDDLNTGSGTVRFQVFGSGTSQELVIQWNNVRFQTGSTSQTITFQAVLREANGYIQFNYLDVTSSDVANHRGAGATVAIKNAGAQSGYVQSERLLINRNSGINPDLKDASSILVKYISPTSIVKSDSQPGGGWAGSGTLLPSDVAGTGSAVRFTWQGSPGSLGTWNDQRKGAIMPNPAGQMWLEGNSGGERAEPPADLLIPGDSVGQSVRPSPAMELPKLFFRSVPDELALTEAAFASRQR